jgi:hypothetical protein
MTMTDERVNTFTDKTDVDSSNLKTVYYNKDRFELFVEFHNGSIAGYRSVPSIVYAALVDATSAGRYYNQKIRGLYTGIPVGKLLPTILAATQTTDVTKAENVTSSFTSVANTYLSDTRGRVEGQPATSNDKRFKVTVEQTRVTRETVEVSGATMEDALANLDVDGKVVRVEWVNE